MIITGQLSGSQDFDRPPEINSSCGQYKDPWAFQKFDDVRMLLKYLSRENDALKHNLGGKKPFVRSFLCSIIALLSNHRIKNLRVAVFEHVQNSEKQSETGSTVTKDVTCQRCTVKSKRPISKITWRDL